MWRKKHAYFSEADGGDSGSAGGSGAGDSGGQGASILAAGAEGAGGSEASSSIQPGGHDFIPEKYRVQKEDGSLDVEASARKVSEAHAALEKRLGTSELPPKSPDEYAPELGDGFNWDEFKSDENMQGFLLGAHAKGITNEQLSYVLGEYLKVAPELGAANAQLSAEEVTAELRTTWKTDKEFKSNMTDAFRTARTFADPQDFESLMKPGGGGDNPAVIRLLSKIGKELREDSIIEPGSSAAQGWDQEVASIRANPAYIDKSHPEHKIMLERMDALYAKRYGTNKQKLGGGRTVTL